MINVFKQWIVKKFGDTASSVISSGAEGWADIMLSAVGEALKRTPTPYFNLSGNDEFLGSIEIKSDISVLNAFYSIRDKFLEGNIHRYKVIVETHYSDMWHVLKLCESSVDKLKKVKSSIDLYDYKINMVKAFCALEKICINVMKSTGFQDFTLKSVIESVRNSPHGSDDDSVKIYKKSMECLESMDKKGFGTFADFVIKLKKVAEDSIEDLQKNVKGECAVYIYNGEYDINFDKLGIKKFSLKKSSNGNFYEDDMYLLKSRIKEENEKKSDMYIKEIDKVYKLCFSVHDKVKKLYYEAFSLCVELKLKCLENVMGEIKKQLNHVHFFVFGADECLCTKNENREDSGVDISSGLFVHAKKIFNLFCESKNDSGGNKKVQDVLYVKKMCDNLKAIYKQIKYSEKSVVELHKTAFKIEKEYKSKMGKVKKLVVRFSDIPFWFTSKMMRVGESYETSVKEAETLEKLTEALNEYIKYLERVNKFKKEILSKYIALEKIVKIKLDEKDEAVKKFAELKEKIEKLNLRKDIDFSGFKKLLNEAKKEVNEAIKKARKAAKGQKKQNRSNSARGSSQSSIPV